MNIWIRKADIFLNIKFEPIIYRFSCECFYACFDALIEFKNVITYKVGNIEYT